MLKGVLWRHLPVHNLVLGTQLDPLGGLVASDGAHVVLAKVVTFLRRDTCLVSDLMEPWPDIIGEEGYLAAARGIGRQYQLDKPVPLAGNQPSVELVSLRGLRHHSYHVVNQAPALVENTVILFECLVEDNMGSLTWTTASNDCEVHREVLYPARSESGNLFFRLPSKLTLNVFLDLGVVILLHFGVLLYGLVLGTGLDEMHLHVHVLVSERNDLSPNAVIVVGIVRPLQIQVLFDERAARHVAPPLEKLHPRLQPLLVRFRRVDAIAAVLFAADVQLEVFDVATQRLLPISSSNY